MYYLLYYKKGTIKKFPLNKSVITIGRVSDNDIVLDDPDISKKHCRIEVLDNRLKISDLNSLNGIFIGQTRVNEATIKLNESFGIGKTDFYYKKGESKGFKVSPELLDIFPILTESKRQSDASVPETEESITKYDKLLLSMVEKALVCDDHQDFIRTTRESLSPMIRKGCLFYVHESEWLKLFDRLGLTGITKIRKQMMDRSEKMETIDHAGQHLYFQIFKSRSQAIDSYLLFFDTREISKIDSPLGDFLRKLSEIFDINRRNVQDISINLTDLPVLFQKGDVSIVGTSSSMRRLVEQARRIAPKSSSVLIMGESGTGKELFSRMIHELSSRDKYVALNCAAIPSHLLESELFGYESGAFTDARKQRKGKLEEASGGTLVLDEIADMPLGVQAKLLRVFQEKSITRLGGNKDIKVDLRIISLTNQKIYELVNAQKFRNDLFFRLRVHELSIPPLRERKADIPGLIKHFSRIYSRRNNVIPGGFSESFRECFVNYDWPGNTRELENEIARILEIIEDHELISDHHILPNITAKCRPKTPIETMGPVTFKDKTLAEERARLLNLLEQNKGNKAKTARAIGMSYRGFLKKLKRLNINMK